MAKKKTIDPLTSVSPRVYKYSFFLGTFPGVPPPVSDPSSSNVCMMQLSRAALRRPTSASQHPPRPPQPTPSPLIQPSGPPPPGPSAGIHEPLYPPGTVPLGLNHLEAVPPGHYPSSQIPFLTPPPGVFSVLVMATPSLPNLTLGILV